MMSLQSCLTYVYPPFFRSVLTITSSIQLQDIICGSAGNRSGADQTDGMEDSLNASTKLKDKQQANAAGIVSEKANINKKPSSAARSNHGNNDSGKANTARSMSAGTTTSMSAQNKKNRKQKVSAADFSDDERDDDEFAIEHDLFGKDEETAILYSDAVKKNIPKKDLSNDRSVAKRSNNGRSIITGKPPKAANTNAMGSTEDVGSGRKVIIKPGQGIKVLRAGKKSGGR